MARIVSQRFYFATVATTALVVATFGGHQVHNESPRVSRSSIVDPVRSAPTLAMPISKPSSWGSSSASLSADGWPNGEADLRGDQARDATRVLGGIAHGPTKTDTSPYGRLAWCATKVTTPQNCLGKAWNMTGMTLVFDGAVGNGIRVRAVTEGIYPSPPTRTSDWTTRPDQVPWSSLNN